MRITKLEYQKKDPNRVNVYVDEKYIAGVEINDVIKLGLYKGQEISPEEINKILGVSEFGKLFNAALNFLSYRPRSEWEIKDHLKRKIKSKSKSQQSGEDGDAKTIEQVLSKLRQIEQINDHAFTVWYVDQRQTFRPMGKRGIKYELIKKGIDRKIIDEVLESNRDNLSEEQLATKAAFIRMENLTSFTNKKSAMEAKLKLQRFLAARGFSWEIISTVVDKLTKEYNKTD